MDLPDLGDIRVAAFFAAFALTFGLAVTLGGKPERYGALTLAAMPLVQLALYSTISAPRFGNVDPVSLAVDLLGLLGFTLIMLRADRLWPIAAGAMMLIGSLAHFARLNTDMLGFSYAQFKAVPTLAAIALVLFGVVTHRWRLRKHGSDRDWVPFARYREFRRIANKANL